MNGAYRDDVPPAAPDARRAAFAAFVRRALDHAKTTRGWSVPRIADESRVGDSTIYRWRDGDWQRSPLADQVAAFCDALDIPRSAAWAILWPDRGARPKATEPAPMDPDVEVLLRRLVDPNVPTEEKFLIRETLRGLAARATRRGRPAG